MKFRVVIFLSLFTIGSAASLYAQTYEEKRQEILNKQNNARAEINVLDARIKSYQKRVAEAEEKFNKSFRQYENLNSLIALQDDKIGNLSTEQAQIQEEINLTQAEIQVRQDELNLLIESYKKILLFAYKNSRSSNLELMLTSNSFNQMLIRAQYLKKFEEQKAKKAEQIRRRKDELDQIQIDLKQSLNRNQIVLQEIQDEKQVLNGQRSQQKQTVESIRSQRTDLVAELTKSREQKEALQNAFSSLIAEADRIQELENERLVKLARARQIADESVRNREVAKYSKSLVSEGAVSNEMLIDNERVFIASKGALQWPVNSKTVSKKFGRTRNPIYGTVTEYLGVNIVTDPAAPVKAVADGYVFQIISITGYGDVVMVKHGSYYTIYGNLSRIDVQKNDIINAGDRVGLSGVQQSALSESLFFAVRHKDYQNPLEWLQK
ncbi:MAG: peptidoglycan DD-metalloendopeptidase family protein [Balneola sp.]